MFINPYENLSGGRWIKAGFHTHAGTGPGTCGKTPIADVVAAYRALGYGALCISNHDLFTDTSALTDEKLLMVPGVEYSADPHILTIGVERSLHALPHQEAVLETNRLGGFPILCHPNWIRREYWTLEQMETLRGYAGIEVANMSVCTSNDAGSDMALDAWDYLLRQGRLVYGFACDDVHSLMDVDRGFTILYVTENNFAGIKNAVAKGAFVASTGLGLEFLTVEKNTLKVGAKYLNENYVRDFNYRFITEKGLAKTTFGETANYALGNEKYVRVEAVGENGALLFAQPVFRDGALI